MNLSHIIWRMLKKGCKLCYKRCIVKYLLHMLSLKYDLCLKKILATNDGIPNRIVQGTIITKLWYPKIVRSLLPQKQLSLCT